jgi:hypothetical protein
VIEVYKIGVSYQAALTDSYEIIDSE